MERKTTDDNTPAPAGKPLNLLDVLAEVPDFRIDRKKKYPLVEVLTIAVCAMIGGAKGPTDFARFGKEKVAFFRRLLPLRNGIPSHDVFRYVFRNMDPKRFNAAITRWMASVADVGGDVVSIDGKNLRRALTEDGRMPCIVSAYASRSRLVVGQVKAAEKSNEITAIPELLETLCLKGAIVTIDAAGCQKKIVRRIRDRGAEYAVSLKGNQSKMHDDVREFMTDPAFKGGFRKATTVDKGHGRVETRTCWQTEDISWFEDLGKWAGLKSFCMVENEVYDVKTKKTTKVVRFFVLSIGGDAKKALDVIRAHWGVESMHWILDMEFDEDRSRARTGAIAENLAMLRHVALNVLRLNKSVFGGISVRRKVLTWSEEKLFRTVLAS